MGDDAILYATEKIFEQISNAELQVVGHAIPFMNTSFGRKIAKLPYGRTLLYKYHARQMLKQIDRSDALILGGGGILCDRESRDVSNDVRLIQYMQSKQKPTIIYAVGVPWLWREKSKKLIKQVVENADYVSCRDPNSAMKIKDLNVDATVHTTGDPAIKIPKLLNVNPKPKNLSLEGMNVCVSLRKGSVNKLMVKSLTKLINSLIKNYDAKINFTPMRTIWYSDDRIAHNLFRDKVKASFFDVRPSVEDFVKSLTDITLVVGMPLHSIILSASMGVPCIAIAYTPDVTSFMEYVQAERCSVSPAKAGDSNLLIEKTEELFDSYTAVSQKLLQNIGKIEEKALLDEKAIKNISS